MSLFTRVALVFGMLFGLAATAHAVDILQGNTQYTGCTQTSGSSPANGTYSCNGNTTITCTDMSGGDCLCTSCMGTPPCTPSGNGTFVCKDPLKAKKAKKALHKVKLAP